METTNGKTQTFVELGEQKIDNNRTSIINDSANSTIINDNVVANEAKEIDPSIASPSSAVTVQISPNETDADNIDNQHHTLHQIATTKETNAETNDNLQYEIGNKWKKLFFDGIFCGRILTLIMALLLLTLSILYCIAQLLTVKLELIKKCEPKTREQIWHNSYLSSSYDNNGEIIMDTKSQYGLNDESCWTTKDIDTNTDQLWFSNKYYHQWTPNYDIKFVLFMFLSIYCIGIIIYNVQTMIIDIYCIKNNKLHTKSKRYKALLKTATKSGASVKTDNLMQRSIRKLTNIYNQYLSDDTSGWIVRSVFNEILELIIQTQALLLYNGYHIFDKSNVYLANKPNYIILFAVIISLNAFGSGFLWLSYSLAHKRCHGLIFKLSIYFIDQFSDLFYTIFPFIIVLTDEYNKNNDNILVLLGQLNIDSALSFFSAFLPLFLLNSKSLLIIRSAVHGLRDKYFFEWKEIQDLLSDADDKNLLSDVLKTHSKVNKENLSADDKELYDLFVFTVHNQKSASKQNWIDRNESLNKNRNTYIKQGLLTITSLLYIIFGIVVLSIVIKYINNSKTYCNSIKEINYININGQFYKNISLSQQQIDIVQTNPELFVWDQCRYKTYPFTNYDRCKCQCRVVVIDWRNLDSSVNDRLTNFNLTQTKILTGMLENWVSLEKFRTVGSEGSFHELHFTFSTNMFRSIHMKAFEWDGASIGSFGLGISSWKQLEYLRFKDTAGGIANLPEAFGDLTEMKYLSFISSGLRSIPISICNLTQLEVIQIEWETHIQTIPSCIGKLKNLRIILVDGCLKLQYIPLSMFSLPNLKILSLFKGSISYEDIIDYNLPNSIDINNTVLVNEWITNNFYFWDDGKTEYYLSLNPICNEDITLFPSNMRYFINYTCDYLCDSHDLYDTFCIPRTLGDGRCNEFCNLPGCRYDNGDCMQLCLSEPSPDIVNCSWQKLNNQICDPGCNNKYCAGYEWGSDFNAGVNPDMFACNYSFELKTNTNQTCQQSAHNSIYIDANVPVNMYNLCDDTWIGDGECDDTCRTEECLNDKEDCSLGCVSDTCNTIYQFWLHFGGTTVYKMNHTSVCKNMWPAAMALFGVDDAANCNESLMEVDFNEDKHINFREFVVIAYDLSGSFVSKGAQINCSECISMEYYNI